MRLEVLSDAVKDDHRVVERITDHRQNSRDKGLVDFEAERQEPIPNRKHAQDQEHVVKQSCDRAQTELELVKAHQDIQKDERQRNEHRPNSALLDVVCNRRADLPLAH